MFFQSIAKASGYDGNLDQYKTISTLGPSGTSSENTALFLRTKLPQKTDIKLFDSYEEAANFALSTSHSLLLVANAYKRINEFYISNASKPLLSFFFDTPPYGIASRHDINLIELGHVRKLRIASHHAPQHLISQLLAGLPFDVIDAASTSLAAEMVSTGEVDACLTTKTACEKERLEFKSSEVNIHMLWTAFTGKELP
jgi:hypothetical protein